MGALKYAGYSSEMKGVGIMDAAGEKLDAVVERLRSSRAPVVLTGAGVSAGSGVPTFRGEGGLWRNYRPEELATPEAFAADPVLVWQWYDWRRTLLSKIEPNPAHYALAKMERRNKGFTLVTQNVDGLHTLAGSHNVLEMHGCIWTLVCTGCATRTVNRDVPIDILPKCVCGALLRPGVVWFGEPLPEDVLYGAFTAASEADFMMVVGTSGVVQPAASLAARAKRNGAFVVEVNLEPTPLSADADVMITGKAGEILPKLVGD